MGEPGTRDILSLAELEAAGNLRTGRKHTLSILVENKPGVLTRIAGLLPGEATTLGLWPLVQLMTRTSRASPSLSTARFTPSTK